MSEQLTWEDPSFETNHGDRTSKWKRTAATLQDNEGKWARLREFTKRGSAYSLASQIRNGRSAWGPKGTFEARAEEKDGEWVVYARYTGEVEVEEG